MKKNYFFYLLIFGLLISINSNAQLTSTFDDLPLTDTTFWNGSDGTASFTSGQALFTNYYNADWFYWSGFAYSKVTDNTTPGIINQYSAIPGMGALQSQNYGVCYPGSDDTIKFSEPKDLNGMYVTNDTYTALSMKNGDDFAKKFGGVDGNDPDWFKLTITAFSENMQVSQTTQVYLADYRFDDNSKDYIVDDWQWVDLSSFKQVSYITFDLSSSDVGIWGMNTPGYFCLDNLTIQDFTDIAFHVTDGSSALDGVSIDFAGTTLTTDINGDVSFSSVSPTTTMEFTASKDGYESYSGNLNGYLVENQEIVLTESGIGIGESGNIALKVYPNPAVDRITIQSGETIEAVSIFNLTGEKLSEHTGFDSGLATVNVSQLSTGVYLLKIKTSTGAAYRQIIKN